MFSISQYSINFISVMYFGIYRNLIKLHIFHKNTKFDTSTNVLKAIFCFMLKEKNVTDFFALSVLILNDFLCIRIHICM